MMKHGSQRAPDRRDHQEFMEDEVAVNGDG